MDQFLQQSLQAVDVTFFDAQVGLKVCDGANHVLIFWEHLIQASKLFKNLKHVFILTEKYVEVDIYHNKRMCQHFITTLGKKQLQQFNYFVI